MTIVWNINRVAEGFEVTQKAHGGAMAAFKSLLDDYHGEPRSESYYDLIAGDWLDKFIQITYAAWQEVLSGAAPMETQPLHLAIDPRTYTLQTLNPDFHDQLRALISMLLERKPLVGGLYSQESTYTTIGADRWQKKLMRALGPTRPKVVFCYPYIKCSHSEWLTTLMRWRSWAKWDDFSYPVDLYCSINEAWRLARASEHGSVQDFPGLLRTMMPLFIPAALLEGFTSLRKQVLNLGLFRPQAIYTAVGLHGHLTFKVLAGEWREEGTSLLVHQHGGSYGVDRICLLEDYECRVADRFYTWGWKRKNSPTYPLSAPYPARFRASGNKILVICCGLPSPVYRIHFAPMPGTIETMVENTKNFLAELPVNKDLAIRLHTGYNGPKLRAGFHSAAPWAAFDEGHSNPFRSYSKSRLTIHNYLGTSWLETMAMDIPTICFCDPDTYAFRAEAKSFIDALERVGILHWSAKNAARFVAGIMDNPQHWWQKPDVRDARQAFVDNYANFSPNWAAQWEAEFSQFMGQ